jgi:hypothetical protein
MAVLARKMSQAAPPANRISDANGLFGSANARQRHPY